MERCAVVNVATAHVNAQSGRAGAAQIKRGWD